jgi:hypothetical protein
MASGCRRTLKSAAAIQRKRTFDYCSGNRLQSGARIIDTFQKQCAPKVFLSTQVYRSNMPTHSTPAGVVVEYFESLRWLVRMARESVEEIEVRRLAAMSTIMAVTSVEVFMNLWFPVHAAESGSKLLQEAVARDLEKKVSLDHKLAQWPGRHFNSNLSLKSGNGANFLALKNRRNSIVHFQSKDETVRAANIIIHGLANTTEYDSLTALNAEEALSIAEEIVEEMFRLAGFDRSTSETAANHWIGKLGSRTNVEAINRSVPAWLVPHVER